MDTTVDSIELRQEGYIYRGIITNHKDWSNIQIIHWYNQREEDSEICIKKLKLDFGGDILPCSDCGTNAIYFMVSALLLSLSKKNTQKPSEKRMILPEN